MSRRSAWLTVWAIALAALAAAGIGGCKSSPPEEDPNAEPTGPYAEIDRLLPRLLAMPPWKFDGRAQHYADVTRVAADPTGLVDVAASDVGAADAALFQECGYKMSVARKYKQPDSPQTLVVAIHEMNDGDAAFAAYSVVAQGKPLSGNWLAGKQLDTVGVAGAAGAPAVANASKIVFVKGRYIVTVDHRGATVPGVKPVADLVAQNIFSGALKPALVRDLPTGRMVPGSELFVTGRLAMDRIKGQLGPAGELLTPAVLGSGQMAVATYEADGRMNTIFAIRYASAGAEAAEATLKGALATAAAPLANSIAFQAVGNTHLVGTLTPEEESVQQVLGDLIANLGG
ncbi:MAG TPA: hypothetical protein PLP01_12615 [Phycisphaerae bacterium]|nr:hypothetical protein [Phycisphaerae bacterium]